MALLLRRKEEITAIYERQIDVVYRVCYIHLRGNVADIEDAIQTTFLNLFKDKTQFCSIEHEKAWLIVTASNVCRNMLSSAWKRRVQLDNEQLDKHSESIKVDETVEYIMQLPEKYKVAVYMFYYEGYSCKSRYN